MSGPKGYSSYRGRGPRWKIAVIVVLVLVIAAAAAVIFLQKYIVYDDSGTPHLQLPEKQTEEPAASGAASSGGDLNITIDKPAAPAELQAVQLSQTPLTDWAAAQTELAGHTAAVVTVKDAQGAVYYDSAAARAVSPSAVKAQSTTAAAVAALTGSDVYAVARLSCLRDPVAAKADVDAMGLKNTGGYIFYDANNENWLDPSKQATQDYLCALVKECAAMGFDEILLTDLTFPTEGKLNKIAYPETGTQAAIDSLLTAVSGALKDYPDVKLSVELPAAVITTGSDQTAGLVLSDIAASVSRIFAVTAPEGVSALSAAVEAAGTADNTPAFVPEVTEAGELTGYVLVKS